jgi:hypothetical protein
MARHRGSPDDFEPTALGGYLDRSRRPAQILFFLLPLILAYEIGLALVLRSETGVLTNKAHESLLVVFDTMGVPARGGLFLGGIFIVVVLLAWHLLNRDPWRVDWRDATLMAAESAALTVPLMVLAILVQQRLAAAAPSGGDLATLGLWSKLTISVGAGLYEELLFRMLLIAVLHTLLVTLARVPHRTGTTIAVVIAAAAFTWYHPLDSAAGSLSMPRMVFFFLAGLYFGLVYVLRGFGIVVAVHAFYDVLVVALWAATGSDQGG